MSGMSAGIGTLAKDVCARGRDRHDRSVQVIGIWLYLGNALVAGVYLTAEAVLARWWPACRPSQPLERAYRRLAPAVWIGAMVLILAGGLG
jgi:hypothetical protein